MVNLVHITDRRAFDEMLAAIRNSDMIAADTEGTGLNQWGGDKPIGISVYTPVNDTAYYYGWGHGTGTLSDKKMSAFDSKGSKAYKQALLWELYCNEGFRDDTLAVNMPKDWLDDLRRVWTRPRLHIYHNAPFDLTALTQIGFPLPEAVADTRVMAHTIFQEWHNHTFSINGKNEQGSAGLKWLARFAGIEGAETGEASLETAIDDLTDRLVVAQQAYQQEAEQRIKARYAQLDKDSMTADEYKAARKSIRDEERRYKSKITDSARLNSRAHMWMLPASRVATYAALDAWLTYGLYHWLRGKISEWDNIPISATLNDVQYHAAWRMHYTGFKLDVSRAKDMLSYAQWELAELETQAEHIAGYAINVQSPKQMVEYLHALGYNVNSAQRNELDDYKDDVELISVAQAAKSITKYASTYIEPWYAVAVNDADNIIHPSFNVTGAKTGRWSSSDDYLNNFQNIPRESSGKLNPKKLLLPLRPNFVMVEVDYTGLETYIGAWVAETLIGKGSDMTLTNLLLAGGDMHAFTRDKAGITSILLGGRSLSEANVKAWCVENGRQLAETEKDVNAKFAGDWCAWFERAISRAAAKTVNFATQYGGGVRAIKRPLNVSDAQAAAILAGWRNAYPAIPYAMKYLESLALKPREMNNFYRLYIRYPELGFGTFTRRYDFYDASARTKTGGVWSPRQSEARNAFNHVTQGTAGLITTTAAMRISKRFSWDEMDLHASVHDSIIFSVHRDDLAVVYDVLGIMEAFDVYPRLKVGLEASPVGAAWGEKRDVNNIDIWINTKGERYE